MYIFTFTISNIKCASSSFPSFSSFVYRRYLPPVSNCNRRALAHISQQRKSFIQKGKEYSGSSQVWPWVRWATLQYASFRITVSRGKKPCSEWKSGPLLHWRCSSYTWSSKTVVSRAQVRVRVVKIQASPALISIFPISILQILPHTNTGEDRRCKHLLLSLCLKAPLAVISFSANSLLQHSAHAGLLRGGLPCIIKYLVFISTIFGQVNKSQPIKKIIVQTMDLACWHIKKYHQRFRFSANSLLSAFRPRRAFTRGLAVYHKVSCFYQHNFSPGQ